MSALKASKRILKDIAITTKSTFTKGGPRTTTTIRFTYLLLLAALLACIPGSKAETSMYIYSPWQDIVWTDGADATYAF
jgi:hypothetical protein